MKTRFERILEQIVATCRKAGRSTHDVSLMAVSKTRTYQEMLEVHSFGQRLFGENRVQEAMTKVPAGGRMFEVRLIGHLQSNKVAKAVELFDGIDSVDSLRLARLIDVAAQKCSRSMPILLEFNTSEESSKSGFLNESELFGTIEQILDMHGIVVRGLMTVGPISQDERVVRGAFAKLANIRERCLTQFPELELPVLSMGMSGDFPWAIQEGATLVRIGSALFGERYYG
jgi:pyridoxal phosphate enzyme (YggS family)